MTRGLCDHSLLTGTLIQWQKSGMMFAVPWDARNVIHFTVCQHIQCVVIANTSSSSDNKDYESPPETATHTSQALHIVQSIAKVEAATTVSSSALFKAKMESVRQAIVDVEVSEKWLRRRISCLSHFSCLSKVTGKEKCQTNLMTQQTRKSRVKWGSILQRSLDYPNHHQVFHGLPKLKRKF